MSKSKKTAKIYIAAKVAKEILAIIKNLIELLS